MKDSGCCGADEFIKLWAYTLTEYHRVVHLDMDTVIFKNLVCHKLIFLLILTIIYYYTIY
jgi:alpha-N-acetylglucosamine transferase